MNENPRAIEELIEGISQTIAAAIWNAYRIGWKYAEDEVFLKANAIMKLKEERDDSDQDNGRSNKQTGGNIGNSGHDYYGS